MDAQRVQVVVRGIRGQGGDCAGEFPVRLSYVRGQTGLLGGGFVDLVLGGAGQLGDALQQGRVPGARQRPVQAAAGGGAFGDEAGHQPSSGGLVSDVEVGDHLAQVADQDVVVADLAEDLAQPAEAGAYRFRGGADQCARGLQHASHPPLRDTHLVQFLRIGPGPGARFAGQQFAQFVVEFGADVCGGRCLGARLRRFGGEPEGGRRRRFRSTAAAGRVGSHLVNGR